MGQGRLGSALNRASLLWHQKPLRVRFVNPDLCLLWCAWKGGLDDFLNRATQPALLLAHRGTSNATPKFYVGLGLRVQQKYKMYGIAREPSGFVALSGH